MKSWFRSLKNWIRALFSGTFVGAWWIISGCSTLSTFFVHRWSGYPRLVLAISAILGFAWANFTVFRKQEAQIATLCGAKPHEESRRPELRITPDNGRYMLVPLSTEARAGDFKAIFLEFDLMIENVGQRHSTVNSFEVEIIELGRSFRDLKPVEGQQYVQGRHCVQGLNSDHVLSKTGMIKIPPENATDHGTLLFIAPGVNLEMFADRGLYMSREGRKFPPLHCRLTLTDTNKFSATAEFELDEV